MPVHADAGVWVNGSSMYKEHCKYPEHGLSGIRCLSTIGWLFTVFFTYTGFILLIIGLSWHCFEKIVHSCKESLLC